MSGSNAVGSQGQRLGAWVLESRLGRGSTGEVWRAHHAEQPTKLAAVKIVTQPASLELLRRECGIAHTLDHPSIVRVIESGLTDPLPFLVMELVSGQSLRQRLDRGPLKLAEAVRIAATVLEALSFAHRRKVIHHDLKPENILIAADGLVKLTDFGLGHAPTGTGPASSERFASRSAPSLPGARGTLGYIAPELLAGGSKRPRSSKERIDLYAFGMIWFEMLVGRLPHGGDEFPSELKPELPESCDTLFRRCTASAKRRPKNAKAVLRLLESLVAAQRPAPCDVPSQRRDQRGRLLKLVAAHVSEREQGISLVTYARDGQAIITATGKGTVSSARFAVRCWGATDGRLEFSLVEDDTPRRVAASADGTWILTSGWLDRSARLWSTVTRQEVHRLHSSEGSIFDAAVSPCGRLLCMLAYEPFLMGAMRRDAFVIRVWDSARGLQIGATRPELQEFPTGVVVSSDPFRVRVFLHTMLVETDLTTVTPKTIRLECHGSVCAHALAPSGAGMLVGTTCGAILWIDPGSSEVIQPVREHPGRITALALARGNQLALSGTADGTVFLWDLRSRHPVARYTGDGPVTAVRFAPDAQRAVFGCSTGNAFAVALPARIGRGARSPQRRSSLLDTVPRSTQNDSPRNLTGNAQGSIAPGGSAAGAAAPAHVAAALPQPPDLPLDSNTLAGAPGTPTSNINRVANLVADEHAPPLLEICRHPSCATQHGQFACSPTGRRVLISTTDGPRLFSVPDRRSLGHLAPSGLELLSLRFCRGDQYVAVGTAYTIEVFATGMKRRIVRWEYKGQDGLGSAWVSADATQAIVRGRHSMLYDIVELRQNQLKSTFGKQTNSYCSRVIGTWDGGDRVATLDSDHVLRMWEISTGRQVWAIGSAALFLIDAAISADGSLVSGISHDGTAWVWAAPRGTSVAMLGAADCVGALPAREPVFIVGQKGGLNIWNMRQGKVMAQLVAPDSQARSIITSADGHYVVAGFLDGSVRIWDVAAVAQSTAVDGGDVPGSRGPGGAITPRSGLWARIRAIWQ